MKISEAVQFYLQYKKANAKGNSLKNYRDVLRKFGNSFEEREIDTITTEEIISFLTELTQNKIRGTQYLISIPWLGQDTSKISVLDGYRYRDL